jgi:hypothetical protein
MNVKPTENEIINDFILDYSDKLLSPAEEKSLDEVMVYFDDIRKSATAGRLMSSLVKKLPWIRARDGFEQKMAARFAMELENETRMANIKNSQNKELIN